MADTTVLPTHLEACWAALRSDAPLVQCLTNVVAAPFTANALLAAGASPAMVDNPQESAAFAEVAGGVLVNLGTPQETTAAAMREAVRGAGRAGTPWVLDPIGAGGLPWRTGVAHELLGMRPPAVVRGNASEVIGLAGGSGGRGADSTAEPDDAAPAAARLAAEHGCVVAVSGEVDLITDGDRVLRLPHGHPWMTRVTGVGCALGALMAGCAAVERDPLVAAACATAALTLAAESAAGRAAGPGSFAAALLDELSLLEPGALAARVTLR